MSDKVKLPREVAEALDTISRIEGYSLRLLEAMLNPKAQLSDEMKVVDGWADKEYGNFDLLLQAIVKGYEVDQIPEDKVKERYNEIGEWTGSYDGQDIQEVVRELFGLLNIKIKGVNA